VDGLSSVQLNPQIGAVGLSAIQSQQGRSHPVMDAAANLLGMSSSDLRSEMQSGQSLASIASARGISQDTLTAALAAAIQQANPTVSSDQASTVATAIATRTPGAGGPSVPAPGAGATDPTTGTQGTAGTTPTHHHHHHHSGGAAMNAASQLLGTSTSDLASSLQSGQSLASIASAQGVSQDALVQAMAGAIQQSDPSISADQATQLATQLATQTPGTQNQPWAGGTQPGATSTFGITA
jgi:lambda repressor-like predicted transcriptional regulator